jgi:hypothetical protein
VLLSDPRVAAVPVRDSGEPLTELDYPSEWWHWSYGDRYWALMTGATAAVYGPVGRDQVAR